MFQTKKHVAGTEGTHNYIVVGEGANGLVAVRLVSGSTFRIRVEPKNAAGAVAMAPSLSREGGWKQPGDQGQDRFSIVVQGGGALSDAVKRAVLAAAVESDAQEEVDGILAAIAMVGTTRRDELIERVRQSGKPGVNSAAKWTTTTLIAKLVVAPEDEAAALADFVRLAKVAGANLASTWGLNVLRRKAVALV